MPGTKAYKARRHAKRYAAGICWPNYPVPTLRCKAVIMPTGKNDKEGIAYVAITTHNRCHTWWADGDLITEIIDNKGEYAIFFERWK